MCCAGKDMEHLVSLGTELSQKLPSLFHLLSVAEFWDNIIGQNLNGPLIVFRAENKSELDPVGSTVRYGMMKLRTGSV